ncbi:MAG: RnfABCDGE type electron transport complex subunit B [Clostridia bacterium]|nr:RnfABCDGE type electron transport complex subunit B [Clostridia bacterium]
MQIIIAALVLGAMGLLFGLLLTLTSKVFAIPANPTRDAVRETLPGANCGACGFPGCDGCADAIAAGKAPVNACPVGGKDAADKIAAIMGVEPVAADNRKVARILCQGSSENCGQKFDYNGIHDCVAASTLNDGFKSCKFACMGLGTCVRACQFDAIHVDPVRHIAVVDEEKCTACGQCVAACPKNVIELRSVKEKITPLCHNTGKGKPVMTACKTGCIACGLCARICPTDAITMVNNLPVIDYDKCIACGACITNCPTNVIQDT